MAPYAVALREIGLADAGRFGRKAATLGALLADGFPVPPGFVLSCDVLDVALGAAGLTGAPTAEQVNALPLPPAVARALAVAYQQIAGAEGAVAVRSSGVAEDGADRSFAGQYESILHVVGPEAVAAAVRACWASAFADRVSRYAQAAGGQSPATRQSPSAPARMAVLVQPMVTAAAAGVAFTANPVTGDQEETVIDAVRGLGDRLAAGGETAETWSVRHGRARRVSDDRRALTAAEAAGIAAVASKVAGALGAPQDIEWALADGRVVLLQSRPITALPAAAPPEDHRSPAEGFWLRGNYSLQPLSPMNVGTVLRAVNRASPDLFRYALGSRIEVRSVEGWSYVRFVQPQDPEELRARLAGIAAALRDGEPQVIIQRWRTRWEPAAVARIERMRAADLAAATDRHLLTHLTRRLAFAERMQRLHFLVGGASTIEWGELGTLCDQALGWDVARILDLLVGLPGKTTEPTVALAPLVACARRESVRSVLLAEPRPSWAEVLRADPELASEADGYLVRFGQRLLGADIAEPTMAERPESVLALVADAVRAGRDPAREVQAAAGVRAAAVAAATSELAGQPIRVRRQFARLLKRAQDAYPLRDDTAFYGHVAWGLFRYAVLALAARLVQRGQLASESDVFLLTLDEAAAALTCGSDQHDLVRRRSEEVAYAARHRGPLTLGTPSGPPVRLEEVLEQADDADRDRLAVVQWADAAYRIGLERTEQDGDLLRGVGASPGTYTGPARILFSEADFSKLRPGDVLVCPETTAQWSVLFSSVGALVTDTGGMLSHPAVIAREYRLPAVVATGSATRLLHDGQLVTVDGRAGLVQIITDPAGGSTAGDPVTGRDHQEEPVTAVRAGQAGRPDAGSLAFDVQTAAAVRAIGLSKTYKSGSGEVTAAADVDLLVWPGECFGLIGPNGAGKSTTIGMLTTLIAPTGGRAEVAGVDVARDPMEVKRRIAVIGQYNSVDRELTIAENLELRGRYSGLRAREARRRTEEMLERFDLVERRNALAGEVSGGQLRRMVIARALVQRPEILFLDEPTAGIDPQIRIELWEMLRKMQADGLTMVLTTHYLEEAEALCERVAIIDRGRVLTCDSVAALRASGGTVVTVVFDGRPALEQAVLLARPGTRSVTLDTRQVRVVTDQPDGLLSELIAAGTRAGVGVLDAHTLRPSLQSVYLTLTGRTYEAGKRS